MIDEYMLPNSNLLPRLSELMTPSAKLSRLDRTKLDAIRRSVKGNLCQTRYVTE